MDYQGFGNGSSGAATLSGTDAPIDSSCSGAASGVSLSATNASFAAGKIVFIHQTRGTGAGSWELNIIESYVAGTITTTFDLTNTYTDSGSSQAQVIQMPEYSSVTISGTYAAKAWDGNVGGIIAFLCNGLTNITGTLTATGKGFRGGTAVSGGSVSDISYQGESSTGTGSQSYNANGMAGGGGDHDSGNRMGGGGGGGHATAGTSGNNSAVGGEGAQQGGAGGGTGGTSNGSTMLFGGAGGAGGGYTVDTAGANSGGIIFILTSELSVTGSLQANGDNGTNGAGTRAGSGGGAGGFIYIITQAGVFGTNLITATGGLGGAAWAAEFEPAGGPGGTGRIYINSCSATGVTNPSYTGTIGGHDFCQSFIHIY